MDHAVCIGCQLLVVCDDDECLVHLVAQVEEELVQLFLVLGIQASCGSSARITDGLLMRARATATRCFSPPDSRSVCGTSDRSGS